MKRLENLSILYVEDEQTLRESYSPFLEEICQTLHVAQDGLEAYALYQKHKPSIVLLDLYVPKLNGIELAKRIRKNDYDTVLIAFTGHSDRKVLLELVDLYFLSYLIKPVTRAALIEALMKASDKIYGSQYLLLPFSCSWDSRSKTLFHEEKQMHLTRRETLFLDLLIKKNGIPSSDQDILEHVWSDKFDNEVANTSIRTLVKNLRKKVPDGLIKSQYGMGYKIDF